MTGQAPGNYGGAKGYLSEPRYKKSELASTAAPVKPAEPGLRQLYFVQSVKDHGLARPQ